MGQVKKEALLIIDVQYFYFEGGAIELVHPVEAAQNARQLLSIFRNEKKLVVHVKHQAETGDEIHSLVEPNAGEKVITKNEVNAFLNTDLLEFLQKNEIKKLVLCGMQTHMCLEAATRAASDFGFECTVIADACATRDLIFGNDTISAKDVHLSTLSTLKSYAKVVDLRSYLK